MSTATGQAPPALAASAQSFLKNLKSETAHQHQMLESQELLSAIMSPSVTVHQYGSYLYLMRQIEQVYETTVLPVVRSLFPFKQWIAASELIGSDLKTIHYLTNTAAPHPYNLPAMKIDLPFALGFMYVMEGSKLGGKVIYKHIRKVLGFTSDNGAGFLANAGGDTGKDWMQFLSIFSDVITSQNAEAEAIDGAIQAFSSIFDYYQSNRLFYAD